MIKYDAEIIRQFAAKLYAQADRVVAFYSIVFALVGGIAGKALGSRGESGTYIMLGVIVMGAIGYFVGQARAFLLRLQAQVALCQVEIERNTRKTVEHTAPLLNPVDPP